MAEASWPASSYNAGAVTEAEYERLAARHTDDGLYNNPLSGSPVAAGSGLQVLVQPNLYGSVRGFFWQSGTSSVAKTIDTNNSTGAVRYDMAVLRLDRATWQVRAAIRKGTAGAGRPALVQNQWDTGVYEIPLAEIRVPENAASISSGNITPYPLYVGSRIRAWSGIDEINAAPGSLRWRGGRDYDGYDGTTWARVLEDTGWQTLTLNGKNAADWTVDNALTYRRNNGWVHLRFSLTRARSTLPLTDADGSTAYVLPVGYRPASSNPPVLGYGNHSRSSLMLYVYETGEVRIYPMTENLPVGRRIYAQAQFPVG